MKIFVTGVCGQLGHDVMNEIAFRNYEGIGSDVQKVYNGIQDGSAVCSMPYISLDITNKEAVEDVLTEILPDVVIHCAAWTVVDDAEDEDKKKLVEKINISGTKYIASVCKKINCKMIYLSTDYVFSGQGTTPWEPDCKDYSPLNIYGKTKLAGEFAVAKSLEKYFIVRIAWVFGENGKNFVKTMLDAGKKYNQLRVVDDQVGTPTYTLDLSVLLIDMAETDKYGYYHVTNEGEYISWYEFAKEIFRQAAELGEEVYSENRLKVIPVTTAEYGKSKAVRPFNSRLNRDKIKKCGFKPLPSWQDALQRYLKIYCSKRRE